MSGILILVFSTHRYTESDADRVHDKATNSVASTCAPHVCDYFGSSSSISSNATLFCIIKTTAAVDDIGTRAVSRHDLVGRDSDSDAQPDVHSSIAAARWYPRAVMMLDNFSS